MEIVETRYFQIWVNFGGMAVIQSRLCIKHTKICNSLRLKSSVLNYIDTVMSPNTQNHCGVSYF